MERLNELKTFLVDNKIVNLNVVYPMIDNVVDEVDDDVDTYLTTATPTANPAAGAVAIGSTVALSCSTANSTIYYTIDGSAPNATKTLYSGPITIPGAITIKAIAYKNYQVASSVLTASYTVAQAATPVASPVAGAVTFGDLVTLTCSTADATIYYTLDGSTPDETDTEYTTPVAITEALTLKAIAISPTYADSEVLSASYTQAQVATPTASLPSSGVPTGTEITLACATADSTIYYTDDGSEPDNTDTEYTAAIALTLPVTIKAIAYADNMAVSAVLTVEYTNTVATPVADPTAGAIVDGSSVTLSSTTSGATIYYTIDGSEPDNTDIEYTIPIVVTLPVTIKAIAEATDMTDSSVLTAEYTKLQVATPVADPAAGDVLRGDEVALTCATTGAAIYYTVDGTAPDATKTLYTAPITITEGITIRAIGILADATDSEVLVATYTITQTATPVASPVAGEVADNTAVALTCATEGAVIYFTTDGTAPTPLSTEYVHPITIFDPVTIKAVAMETIAHSLSDVLTAVYTIAA